jgi:hypothetical protein
MKTKDLFKKTDFKNSSLGLTREIEYKKLVDAFGRPNESNDGEKTDAEWRLETKNGLYFTIYNYKSGKNYNGKEGDKIKDITDWHFGVAQKEDVPQLELLLEFLGL